MKLYVKQHIFTWGDRFSIYDEYGNERYFAEGEVFSFGKKLHLLDAYGYEQAFIYEKVFSWRPRYYINRGGREVAEVVKQFSLFRQEYQIAGLGWSVMGDLFSREFEITNGISPIVRVYREWFTLGDAYAIDIAPEVDEALALSVVLVIDAVLSEERG